MEDLFEWLGSLFGTTLFMFIGLCPQNEDDDSSMIDHEERDRNGNVHWYTVDGREVHTDDDGNEYTKKDW